MAPFHLIHKLFLKRTPQKREVSILLMDEQIKAWRWADQKMGWEIDFSDFDDPRVPALPPLTDSDRMGGFIGTVLFYGFGEDGQGNSDVNMSILAGLRIFACGRMLRFDRKAFILQR
jgi:hypothetical protein